MALTLGLVALVTLASQTAKSLMHINELGVYHMHLQGVLKHTGDQCLFYTWILATDKDHLSSCKRMKLNL